MKTSDGILAGILTCTAYLFTVSAFVDKKINDYNITIDPANKELKIKCNANEISLTNFQVYTRLDKKHLYLYTKGTEVLASSKDIVTVDHKYRIKHINPDDIGNMTWSIDDNKLVVTIPLSNIDKRLSVKRIK